jgi:hypothetical protein
MMGSPQRPETILHVPSKTSPAVLAGAPWPTSLPFSDARSPCLASCYCPDCSILRTLALRDW